MLSSSIAEPDVRAGVTDPAGMGADGDAAAGKIGASTPQFANLIRGREELFAPNNVSK